MRLTYLCRFALVSAVTILAGCSRAPSTLHQGTKTSRSDDQIVFGISWEPNSFNPLKSLDSGSYFGQTLVYEGLVKYDPSMRIVPALAETFSISKDQKTYKFQLRPKLCFSDGSLITVDDVLSSFQAASSKASPFKTDFDCIEKIESDKKSGAIVLHLSRVSAPLLSRLIELRVLPAAIWNQPDHGTQTLSRTPVASGPFRLKRWESGLELVFEPNPFYWGDKPKMKQLVWRVVPDKTFLGIALRRGELDVAAVDPLNCNATFSMPEAKNRTVGASLTGALPQSANKIVVDEFNGSRTVYLGFNAHKKPFSEKLVRQSIAMSIDRAALARVLFAGYAIVPRSDVSPGNPFYNDKVVEWNFDRQKAVAVLKEAGYELTNRGWCQPHSDEPLSFRILTVKDFQDVAQVVSDNLGDMKIPTEVQVLEYTTLRSNYLKKGDFDVFLWSRSSGIDPDCALVWGTGGALNFCGFSDPKIDALIEKGRSTTDPLERVAAYEEIQANLAQQLPWVFLVQPKLLVAHKDNISNVKQACQQVTGLPWDNPLFNAPRWERKNRE
ncbi:MAG: ABC transporter substrate-binding protein [Candidatus Obscuribacterales bacterium]|nr:ABC transporter substrate-binding protein [Candidatus Obscuribacterales bacterium]